jgi:hypothetical protein
MKIFLCSLAVLVVLLLGGIFWMQYDARQEQLAKEAALAAQAARQQEQAKYALRAADYDALNQSLDSVREARGLADAFGRGGVLSRDELIQRTNQVLKFRDDFIVKAVDYGFLSKTNGDQLMKDTSLDSVDRLVALFQAAKP